MPTQQEKDLEKQQRELKLFTHLESKINKLKIIRGQWEHVWNDIANCIDPYVWLSPYTSEKNKGIKSRTGKFKSATAAEAYDVITALETKLCSKATRWAGIEIGKSNLKGIENNKEWQNFKNDSIMSNFYKITDSYRRQFYQSNHKLFTEAFMYGTACRYIRWSGIEEDSFIGKNNNMMPVDISFDCPPINRMLFEKNGFNEITFAAQEIKLSIGAAASIWGMDKIMSVFNITSIDQYYAQEGEEKDFIHIVMERGGYNPQYPETKFVGYVLNMQARKILANTENINYMPYNIFKLLSFPGEYYGRSLTFFLIDDIEYSDHLLHQFRQAAEFAIRPPFLMATGMEFPKSGILPGCGIPGGKDSMGNNTIERLDLGSGIQISEKLIELKQQEIHNRMLFGNMISPQDTAGMTETQVCELMVAHDNRISPVATAWQADDMFPTAQHILRYLFHERGGGIEFPYETLGIDPETIGHDPVNALEITYTGMLGREQKKYDNLQITSIVNEALSWAQANPNIIDKIDLDKAFDVKLKNADLLDTIQRTEDEVQGIREQRAQAQQEQAQQQEFLQGIDASLKIAQMREKLTQQ